VTRRTSSEFSGLPSSHSPSPFISSFILYVFLRRCCNIQLEQRASLNPALLTLRQNWGTLRSVQYLAVPRLLRIVLCVPICNSGADRKWGGIKTEQPTGTTKIAWRRAFSQFLQLVNCGVLTACLSSRNLYFVCRKFEFYSPFTVVIFLFTTLSANSYSII